MEKFSTVAITSFGDFSQEAVKQTRVLCLICEAVYTHWLQCISSDTVSKHLLYLRLCPWPIETLEYRGACRESPLKQPFHTLPHRIPKNKAEARLNKNNYQKSRHENASDMHKKVLLQKKKIYRTSPNERRKELRKFESPDEKARRLQRRYKEPQHRSELRDPKVKAASKCSHCRQTGHNARTCTQNCVGKPEVSIKCHECRLVGHNSLSCPPKNNPVEQ